MTGIKSSMSSEAQFPDYLCIKHGMSPNKTGCVKRLFNVMHAMLLILMACMHAWQDNIKTAV